MSDFHKNVIISKKKIVIFIEIVMKFTFAIVIYFENSKKSMKMDQFR